MCLIYYIYCFNSLFVYCVNEQKSKSVSLVVVFWLRAQNSLVEEVKDKVNLKKK